MLGDVGRMALLAALSYPLSLVNQMVISRQFGTSAGLDAYWVAFFALMFACAPVLAAREGFARDVHAAVLDAPAQASRVFSAHLNALFLFCAAICLGVWALAGPLAGLLAWDAPQSLPLLAALLPPLALAVALLQVNESLTAALTANGRPVCGHYGRLMGAAGSIAAVAWLGASLGVQSLVLGLLAANLAFLGVQLAALRGLGLRYRPLCRPAGWLSLLAAPLICHIVLNQAASVYVRLALQSLGPSFVSSYQYALSLYSIPENVILLSIHGAFWALLGRRPGGAAFEARRVWSVLRVAAALMAGATVVLWVFSEPIARLLFLRGAFDQESLRRSAQALALLSLGLVPQSCALLYGRYLLLRKGLGVAGAGWSIQALAGMAAAWAGQGLGLMPLVLLQGAIGGVAAMAFFLAVSRERSPARAVRAGRFARLAALVAAAALLGTAPDMARLPALWQWLALPALCCAVLALFFWLCLLAGAASRQDLRAAWVVLVRKRSGRARGGA